LSESDVRMRRAHLGRRRARCQGERTYRDSRSAVRSRVAKSNCRESSAASREGYRPAENVEGPLGLPGRPFSHWRVLTRQVAGGPPQIPLSPTRPRLNWRHDRMVVGRSAVAAASQSKLCRRSVCT
jgi:hypothetical protein